MFHPQRLSHRPLVKRYPRSMSFSIQKSFSLTALYFYIVTPWLVYNGAAIWFSTGPTRSPLILLVLNLENMLIVCISIGSNGWYQPAKLPTVYKLSSDQKRAKNIGNKIFNPLLHCCTANNCPAPQLWSFHLLPLKEVLLGNHTLLPGPHPNTGAPRREAYRTGWSGRKW